MDVEALGTQFNINSYSDEPAIKTTLIEGAVRVTQNAARVILKPGEQAVLAAIHHSPLTIHQTLTRRWPGNAASSILIMPACKPYCGNLAGGTTLM